MATGIPKKLGKYDVLDVIGWGGMGIVYKATDPGIGRVVAIKMVTGSFSKDPELLKRFYREAQSAGQLQHPNIVTIHDLGDQDGHPYMVMEYLEGESLESIITSRRSVPLEQKLHTIIQLCNALSYAHQHNVIHRDIKPANVMVLKDLTVKIVDFGIARIGNENVTRPGQLMGSIPYMSPEQIKEKAYVDSRTDIFSVGVVLYQLLTYALPFDGEDVGAIVLKIVHEPPPPLQTYLAAYPEELDHIIAHALAKNSEERYPTADRLAIDLMRVHDELKRDTMSEYLLAVDNLIADSQWNQAKERILQILRIDWQNSRANELLRKVEQQIQTQKRGEQARELRVQAEQAIGRNELKDALRYLDLAVELDSSHDLLQLRNSVVERKARVEKLTALLHRAESALDAGELEEARKAVGEALLLDRDSREAQALSAIVTREIAEQNKLKMVQGFLDEARNRIASRSFTAALDVLKKAALLAPNVPGIKELANLAASGQEQERRRKQLEGFYTEIEEALNRDDFVLACARADEGLHLFPDDRGLLKFKKLAEKQLQASEKRTYVEGQIAAARQLLESTDSDQSLVPLEEALEKYSQEPMLVSMLSVVKETLARRQEEQRKADCIQKAKDAIRRKAYTEAIETLEATRNEISSSDLDDLLQFAQEEAANYAARQKIDAAADQARQFIAVYEYQSTIELLEATLAEIADEELSIILEDARRRLQEFNQRVQESISTAQRLLRNDRCSEAVRFLEAQPEQYGKSTAFAALLEQARHDLKRIQSFSIARENAREALSHNDFLGAAANLQEFRDNFGDTPDAKILQNEIEATRSRAATAAMEKALPDVRMLLMVRSFDSAEGILDSLSQWSAYAAPAVKEQYESFCAFVLNAKERQAANVQAEKLKQAQMSGQATSVPEDAQEGVDAGDEIGPTVAMSHSQLRVVLDQVAQIGDHYQDNDKVQTALQDFMRRLTLKIETLEEEIPSSITRAADREIVSAPPPSNLQAESRVREQSVIEIERQAVAQAREGHFEQALSTLDEGLKQFPDAEPLRKAWESALAAHERAERVAEAQRLRGDGEFGRALELLADLRSPPGDRELKVLKLRIESDKAKQRLQAIADAQRHLRDGQVVLAIEVLQRSATRFPDDEVVSKLLRVAEEQLRKETEWNSVRVQAEALLREGQEEEAVVLLENRVPKEPAFKELLGTARSALNAKRREGLLSQAVGFQRQARYGEAKGLVQQAIRQYGSNAAAAELERALQDQIEIERRRQARDADRDKLLAIEQQVPTTKQSKLKKLAVGAQQIAAPYTADDEVAAIALRIRQQIESQLSATAPPKPIPLRPIVAGAAAILAVLVGIVAVPRLLRVTTVPVEIRTDPPGASVSIGDKSCVTPNCRLELAPGQYHIEAQMTGFKQAESSLTVDSHKHTEPINLTMQPLSSAPIVTAAEPVRVNPPVPPPNSSADDGTKIAIRSSVSDALVFLDGAVSPVGRTDSKGRGEFAIAPGSHQVRIEKAGFQPSAVEKIDARAGKVSLVQFTPATDAKKTPVNQQLEPQPAVNPPTPQVATAPVADTYLVVQAPASAEIHIDQQLAGYSTGSPFKTKVQPGQRTVDVLLPGHQPFSKVVAVSPGSQVNVTANLTMMPGPTDTFTVSPETIAPGTSAQLVWATQNAQEVTIDGEKVNPSGSKSVSPASTRKFTLIAKGPGGTNRDEVFLNVRAEEVPREASGKTDAMSDQDKAAIQKTLNRYAEILLKRKAKSLKEVWPTVSPGTVNTLQSVIDSSKNMSLSIIPGKWEPYGTGVLVTCQQIESFERNGKQTSQKSAINFYMVKSQGAWIISDIPMSSD